MPFGHSFNTCFSGCSAVFVLCDHPGDLPRQKMRVGVALLDGIEHQTDDTAHPLVHHHQVAFVRTLV